MYMPMQLGPRILTPYCFATALTQFSSSVFPASANPLLIITAAATPLRPASSIILGTVGAGVAITATSTGSGISATDL